ncbi:MAG TPA: isochorismatase family cysteine hydrolase [Acidimicrobiia bacterium]|nr:isochorismatase family cysteine hydrolase [Acidimicrobiia bacterium]
MTFPGTRAAIVTIDLHRGHLDPTVATMPLAPDAARRIVEANRSFLAAARGLGAPIIHLLTRYRTSAEALANPFWASRADTSDSRGNVAFHQVEPSEGIELMPGILDPDHDSVIDTKKRYDCFVGTDLGFVLDVAGVDTLLLTGVNTNSCVLTTAAVASTRDYSVVVVSDCVDSMDGAEFHHAALECIERAFGWVMSSGEALEVIGSTVAPSRGP